MSSAIPASAMAAPAANKPVLIGLTLRRSDTANVAHQTNQFAPIAVGTVNFDAADLNRQLAEIGGLDDATWGAFIKETSALVFKPVLETFRDKDTQGQIIEISLFEHPNFPDDGRYMVAYIYIPGQKRVLVYNGADGFFVARFKLPGDQSLIPNLQFIFGKRGLAYGESAQIFQSNIIMTAAEMAQLAATIIEREDHAHNPQHQCGAKKKAFLARQAELAKGR
ncbi:MAG: hypothetical protein AB7G80_06495 [Dongiaceae bacterium]